MSFIGHLKGLSRMKRELHVRFLGEGAAVMPPPYPARSPRRPFGRKSGFRALLFCYNRRQAKPLKHTNRSEQSQDLWISVEYAETPAPCFVFEMMGSAKVYGSQCHALRKKQGILPPVVPRTSRSDKWFMGFLGKPENGISIICQRTRHHPPRQR